ncbi:PaaI family thioesterase [Pseudohoeflea coraliihabitans]|uniref:Medium/long-chain acyl-CoA thioesterase YigI n=1 Tax=Pseudohoeflea coraliihabitans TaxID=2860393 RepID=A0ABS6WUE3_9HYPH|nr:PaaI family thioesterase [Pseudohoeflea sp. DP4N28-3]MBW3099057.1 PaaI family thioesterase [Pseudohoeflea sp. DP4N28-3]
MIDKPDSRFRQRVEESYSRQNAMRTIGAELTSIEYGTVELEMPFSEALTQQHGFLHAGILSTALDSACGYAALSVMPADAAVLTIEFKINLLSPGRGTRFLFRGEVTKPGNTIIVSDGRAFALDNGPAKLIASMTATMMVVRGREGMAG